MLDSHLAFLKPKAVIEVKRFAFIQFVLKIRAEPAIGPLAKSGLFGVVGTIEIGRRVAKSIVGAVSIP